MPFSRSSWPRDETPVLYYRQTLPFEPPGKSLKRQGSSQTREENPPFSSGVPVAPSTDKTYITFNVKKKSLGSSPLWQFSSVTQSSRTLCDPMDCSTPGFPVHHQLLELAQIHVHRVRDAIQPTLPLLSPSPPTFNLSQHHGLFQWVNPSYQVSKLWQSRYWRVHL